MLTSEEFYCDQADTVAVQNDTFSACRAVNFGVIFLPLFVHFSGAQRKQNTPRTRKGATFIGFSRPSLWNVDTSGRAQIETSRYEKTGVRFDGDSQLNSTPSKHTIKTRKPVSVTVL